MSSYPRETSEVLCDNVICNVFRTLTEDDVAEANR
jgi:hypothetical protein